MSTTPNIGIYIPTAGETNYDQSFSAGMINIDQHDHSGGPNKGVQITTGALSDFSVTYRKLNANVADPTTGIGVNAGIPNQLILLGTLPSIFNLSTDGFITKDGSNAHSRVFQDTDSAVWTNPDGVSGDPEVDVQINGTTNQIAVTQVAGVTTIGFDTITRNTTQPAFSAGAALQSNVTGKIGGQDYTVQFTTLTGRFFQQGSGYDGTSTFTCPRTGVYLVNALIELSDLNTTASDCVMQFITGGSSSDTFTFMGFDPGTVENNGIFRITGTQLMKLTFGDTVYVNVNVDQGDVTNEVDILGGTFSAILVW